MLCIQQPAPHKQHNTHQYAKQGGYGFRNLHFQKYLPHIPRTSNDISVKFYCLKFSRFAHTETFL